MLVIFESLEKIKVHKETNLKLSQGKRVANFKDINWNTYRKQQLSDNIDTFLIKNYVNQW